MKHEFANVADFAQEFLQMTTAANAINTMGNLSSQCQPGFDYTEAIG